MNKQAILDVLNSLEVVDQEGGDSAFILVENTVGNRERLNAVGVDDALIHACGDEETFCILALAFNEGYADDYEDRKLVLWGPIDDDLRYRVSNGEGKSSDAERLLRELSSLQKENERWNTLRPEVQWFAEQMELQLKAHDHKTGWQDLGKTHLLSLLTRKADDLSGSIYFNELSSEIVSEAADVANYAMMIADNSRIREGESHE